QLTNNANNAAGALATEICTNMIGSAELFTFADVPSAQVHFRTRANIVATIGKMKEGGPIDFGIVTTHIQYPGTWWMPRLLRATQAPLGMRAKPGVAASVALDSIVQSQTRSGCEQAQIAAVVIGHRMEFGNVWIDAQIPPGRLTINTQNYFTEMSLDQTTYIPGDVMYMTNKDDYKEKAEQHSKDMGLSKPFLVWQGENTIYSGGGTTRTNGKFKGLGLPLLDEAGFREGITKGQPPKTGNNLAQKPKEDKKHT